MQFNARQWLLFTSRCCLGDDNKINIYTITELNNKKKEKIYIKATCDNNETIMKRYNVYNKEILEKEEEFKKLNNKVKQLKIEKEQQEQQQKEKIKIKNKEHFNSYNSNNRKNSFSRRRRKRKRNKRDDAKRDWLLF
jgi:hypothetical protein